MAKGDARGSNPETAGRDQPSSPRVVVRTPSGPDDNIAFVAADTAVAARSQAMAAEIGSGEADTGHAMSEDQIARSATMPGATPVATSAASDPMIGIVLLERYQITRKLGQGGMGAVYEAQHKLIGKRVAVKVLLDKYAQKGQIVARLEQEARLASAIGHEHIIDITDFGETADGRTFVVMEYLEGESLAECIQREGRLPEPRAIRIAHQIANALHAAHEKGILHRDVKPENTFLLSRQGADFVKVVDFGISKDMRGEDERSSPRLTQTGMVLGTPLYMSPEQARGAEEIDRRVDVYSLGVILYEMTTGEVPFRGNNYLSVIAQVLNEEPTAPRELCADISAELEAIILRALEKEPAQRYQTCEVLASDLAKLMEEPGTTGTRGRITAMRRRRRRAHKRQGTKVLTWVAGVAVIVSAMAVTVRALLPSQAPPASSARPEPVMPAPPLVPVAAAVVPAPPADAAAPVFATINIMSYPPGATIWEGGRELGVTPLSYPVPKESRTIELVAEIDGYDESKFAINPFLDDGKQVSVRLAKPKRGAAPRRTIRRQPDTSPKPPQPRLDTPPEPSREVPEELSGNPYKRPSSK